MDQSSKFKTLCNKVRGLNLVALDIVSICNSGMMLCGYDVDECCICYVKRPLAKLQCGHEFCKYCIRKLETDSS